MKSIRKVIAIGLSILLLFFVLLTGMDDFGNSNGIAEVVGLPEMVLRWESKVTKEAEKNGIVEAVPYLLGIIMVETGGNSEKYPDVMQCSESQGKPPNSIQDPDESIEVGVKYFADMFKGYPEYDLLNIVQAYNFGGGFLSSSGKEYTLEKAIQFSKSKAGGEKVSYPNPIAINLGYDYRFNYGNMFYSQLVKQYIQTGNTSNSGNSDIVKMALNELSESPHQGGQKYWSWYGFNSRVEWCAIFVSYNAEKAGVSMERFAYCPTGIENFKAKNQWKSRAQKPKDGDIIFFDWNGNGVSDHVGIVEKVENGRVHTIEGNSGDKIARLSYEQNSQYIMGYGSL
ncbi:hypothetical protein IGI39_002082 [Enterococcus sp. AZ135]